jgi:Holliday junction resolvase RusA-like endonuclease
MTDDNARAVEEIRTRCDALEGASLPTEPQEWEDALAVAENDRLRLLAVIDRQEARIKELLDACRQRDTVWDNGIVAERNWRKAGRTIRRMRNELADCELDCGHTTALLDAAPMITVHWTGKAISDNAKTVRDRRGVHRNSPEYIAYRNSVAWSIREQRPGVRLKRPGLFVQFRLDGHCDATNMLKGLLDGIQDSELVANDRHIAPITVLPTLHHGRGATDEAWLVLWEADR